MEANKIITRREDFKKVLEKEKAYLLPNSMHFYSEDGRIIEYHIEGIDKIKDPRYIKPEFATHEEVNYFLE